MPRVSVLMPVYNGEMYLREAVDSILNQTFPDFEFLIIDDGSTDSTLAILRSYNDPRIRIVVNEQNAGITFTLNRGIKLAQGEFIARMDADDIATTNRFALQVQFLDAQRQTALIGGAAVLIDKDGTPIGEERSPESAEAIRGCIFSRNPFVHGTVTVRKAVLDEMGGYDARFLHNEDYDLWLRIASKYPTANLPDIVLQRRIHETNITVQKKTELTQYRLKTLSNAVFHYYRSPAKAVFLLRPWAAFRFRQLRGVFQ